MLGKLRPDVAAMALHAPVRLCWYHSVAERRQWWHRHAGMLTQCALYALPASQSKHAR